MTTPKIAKIAGWILSVLLAALFFFSASFKFSGAKEVIEGFEKIGLKDKQLLIGSGEVISTLLFLVPVTLPLGALLLSSYMGGAIMAHMSHGESYVVQSVILVLIWVATFLRRPQTLVDRAPWGGDTRVPPAA